MCQTLKHVVLSTAEVKTGRFFINGQDIIPLRYGKNKWVGHPQPPTLLKTDNSTSNGFFIKT